MGKIIKNKIDYTGGSSLPDGGSTGQVIAKKSDADRDVEWVDPPQGVVDNAMSDTSENAVQNKVIKDYVDTEIAENSGIFYAKRDVTTAQELIAAHKAGKIILLAQTAVATTYPFVVLQFNEHNSSHCSMFVYNVNGSTISQGVMVIKYTVVNNQWIIQMQNLQNKLVSGTDIKTLNGESLLGSGDIELEDKTYEFTQATPSDEWQITHTLDKFPSVTIVDSAGSVVIGDIQYVSKTQIVITFQAPFAGKAYLN